MVEPSKAGGPPHCGWPSSYPFEPLNRTKRQIAAFLALKLSDSDLDLAPSAFYLSGLWIQTPPTFLVFHIAEGRLEAVPRLYNHMSQFL